MLKLKLLLLLLFYINYGKYYVVKSKGGNNHHCDLAGYTEECNYPDVGPGDTVTYMCKYTQKRSYYHMPIGDEWDRCYTYISRNESSRDRELRITNSIFGFHDFSIEESNGITTASITVPPFIFKDMDFKCLCYTDGPDNVGDNINAPNVIKRVITVHVRKGTNLSSLDVAGCNLRKWDTENNFRNLIYVRDPDIEKVCNVYNVKSSTYVTAICPHEETLEPQDCLTHVYKYKGEADFLSRFLNENEYEKVGINTLISNKTLGSIGGGKSFKYGQIPADVTDKAIFFCYCIRKSKRKGTRINFFLNMNSDDVLDMWRQLSTIPQNQPVVKLDPSSQSKPPATETHPFTETVTGQSSSNTPSNSSSQPSVTSDNFFESAYNTANESTYTDLAEPPSILNETMESEGQTSNRNSTNKGRGFSFDTTLSLFIFFSVTFVFIF